MIDLVRVVRLKPLQAVILQTGGSLQALFERHLRMVRLVEAAVRRSEEPDAGREFEVEFKILQVMDKLVGSPTPRLRTKVDNSHDGGSWR